VEFCRILQSLGILALASLAVAACEHPHRQLETDIVMSVAGDLHGERLNPGSALLTVRERFGDTLTFEVSQAGHILFKGALDAHSLSELLSGVNAPMHPVFGDFIDGYGNPTGGKALSVSQSGLEFETPAHTDSGGQGRLQFSDGWREMRYHWGVITRQIRGAIQLEIGGGENGSFGFSGRMVQEPLDFDTSLGGVDIPRRETIVGTRSKGSVDASVRLGGAFWGSKPAKVSVDLTAGRGMISIASRRRSFSFSPAENVLASYEGKMELLSKSESYVELQDDFLGYVHLSSVDLNDPKASKSDKMWFGSGDGTIEYHLSLAVSPTQIVVVARNSMKASIQTVDGERYLNFNGSMSETQLTLDW
jgi:hypothetical protein